MKIKKTTSFPFFGKQKLSPKKFSIFGFIFGTWVCFFSYIVFCFVLCIRDRSNLFIFKSAQVLFCFLSIGNRKFPWRRHENSSGKVCWRILFLSASNFAGKWGGGGISYGNVSRCKGLCLFIEKKISLRLKSRSSVS